MRPGPLGTTAKLVLVPLALGHAAELHRDRDRDRHHRQDGVRASPPWPPSTSTAMQEPLALGPRPLASTSAAGEKQCDKGMSFTFDAGPRPPWHTFTSL